MLSIWDFSVWLFLTFPSFLLFGLETNGDVLRGLTRIVHNFVSLFLPAIFSIICCEVVVSETIQNLHNSPWIHAVLSPLVSAQWAIPNYDLALPFEPQSVGTSYSSLALSLRYFKRRTCCNQRGRQFASPKKEAPWRGLVYGLAELGSLHPIMSLKTLLTIIGDWLAGSPVQGRVQANNSWKLLRYLQVCPIIQWTGQACVLSVRVRSRSPRGNILLNSQTIPFWP